MFNALGRLALGEVSDEASQAGALIDMLSAEELAHMRTGTGLLMPDTCNILSVTQTADGFGGITQTWGTVVTVACRLDIVPTQHDEQVNGSSLRNFQETVLSIPFSTSIAVTNRVEHGGYTYNVLATNVDQSWIAVKRATLERIE
jgi:hypothetical protein